MLAPSRHNSRQTRSVLARAAERKQLPIFPLNVVALPNAMVPLMIFEARYRVLFNTLLAGSPNVEDGLVQEDSPFAGSKRFGMCFLDEKGRLAAIGTTLEIQDFVRESGGRMYVTNKGVERFRIVDVVKEQPVLLCEVEVLAEDDDDTEDAKKLADEVAELFRTVLRLHMKMARKRRSKSSSSSSGSSSSSSAAGLAAEAAGSLASESEDETIEAPELTDLNPQQLSFWIAHAFTDSKYTQQKLLEENNTIVRLSAERELLASTLKYYRAATALDGIFGEGPSSAGSSEVATPPPGGPD